MDYVIGYGTSNLVPVEIYYVHLYIKKKLYSYMKKVIL